MRIIEYVIYLPLALASIPVAMGLLPFWAHGEFGRGGAIAAWAFTINLWIGVCVSQLHYHYWGLKGLMRAYFWFLWI